MNRTDPDRILADWDRVSRQARPPALPHRTVITSTLPGSTIAGVAILIVAVAAGSVWLGLPREEGSPGVGAPAVAWGPLAVAPASDGMGEALTSGTLRITDTCVFLEEAGGDQALLVWPADRTTWSSDTRAITLENLDKSSVTFRDGDRVTFGGGGDTTAEGGVSSEEWIANTAWIARPAATCPLDSRWFVGDVLPGG